MLFERISRAIRASAIGDSVGYVFEFDENPLPSEVLACAPRHKVISDDMQMTLFTLAALPGITPSSAKAAFTESYLQWLQTQDGNPNLAKTSHGLLAHPELYAHRFPGDTCLSALRAIASGSPVRNNSKGCGSASRILPLLYLTDLFDRATLIQMAVDSAEVTHHHPANAVAVRQLMEAYYTLLLGGALEPIDVTGMLGWTADECVAMAINAVATASDFDDLLVKTICHAGDSDSVAAVAAGLWGLTNTFPDEYYSTIKEKEVIESTLLSFKEYLALCEGKQVGVVYHFTKPTFYEMLVDYDTQQKNLGTDAKEFTMYAQRGLSLTRKFDMPPVGDVTYNRGFTVRIAIDGNRLSDRYEVKPVSGFMINQPDANEVLNVKSPFRRLGRLEAEELVLPKEELVHLKDYIISIDFLAFDGGADPRNQQWREEQVSRLRSMGIKTSIQRKLTRVTI